GSHPFLCGLAGGSGFRERPLRLVADRLGRVDLAVEEDGSEATLVIIGDQGNQLGQDPPKPASCGISAVISASYRPILTPLRRWKQASGLAASSERFILLARPAPRLGKRSRRSPAGRPSWPGMRKLTGVT